MSRRTFVLLAALAAASCNAESPTELADFNAALIDGRYSFSFSGAACAPPDIEASIGRFSNGGALPAQIGLLGSWQTVGESDSNDLGGTVDRDTGEVVLELITGVRIMEGIFIDQDNLALAFSDEATGCRARASGQRIE